MNRKLGKIYWHKNKACLIINIVQILLLVLIPVSSGFSKPYKTGNDCFCLKNKHDGVLVDCEINNDIVTCKDASKINVTCQKLNRKNKYSCTLPGEQHGQEKQNKEDIWKKIDNQSNQCVNCGFSEEKNFARNPIKGNKYNKDNLDEIRE